MPVLFQMPLLDPCTPITDPLRNESAASLAANIEKLLKAHRCEYIACMKRPHIIALTVLIALFLIAILGNNFATRIYLAANRLNRFDFFMALGLLGIQPCLLSIWCALGAQKAIWRIPVSMGMLTLLTMTYSRVLSLDGAPLKAILVICAVVAATVGVLQIPLWIFRIKSKYAIALPLDVEPEISASQFGISHLLFATTLAAILLAIGRVMIPDKWNSGAMPLPWSSLIVFLIFHIVLATVLAFLLLGTVFNQNRRIVFLVFLLLFLVVAPLGSILVFHSSGIMSRAGPQTWTFDFIKNAYTFVWTIAIGIAAVLSFFYLIGFRLQRER